MTGTISQSRQLLFERERGVYAIRAEDGLAHVLAQVGDGADRQERIQSVFRALAGAGIPIFLIKLHATAITFAVHTGRVPDVERSLERIALGCSARPDVALVTVVATSMRDLTGVMVSIADALQRAGANLYGVGDSHNTVQCLMDGASVQSALRELRAEFNLFEGEEAGDA